MMAWSWHTFEELTKEELYEILKLRQQVFVIEQNCVYQDVDGWDGVAKHLFCRNQNGLNNGEICAYLRVLPAKTQYEELSLGRVIVANQARGKGLGKSLMEKALSFIGKEYPKQAIRISAQEHLEKYYSAFGFECVSEPYVDDGILHVEMLRQ